MSYSRQTERFAIAETIRVGFKNIFGFETDTIIRSKDEMAAIISNLSYSPDEIAAAVAGSNDVEHLYVYLLKETPEAAKIEGFIAGYAGFDKLCLREREIYLLCQHSVRDSKLAAKLGKINIPMTARNWKTISRLCEMLGEGGNDYK